MNYYWPFPCTRSGCREDDDLWRAQAILIRGDGAVVPDRINVPAAGEA